MLSSSLTRPCWGVLCFVHAANISQRSNAAQVTWWRSWWNDISPVSHRTPVQLTCTKHSRTVCNCLVVVGFVCLVCVHSCIILVQLVTSQPTNYHYAVMCQGHMGKTDWVSVKVLPGNWKEETRACTPWLVICLLFTYFIHLLFLTLFLWFLPRNASIKRGISHRAVSVCLSVTFVDHVETNKHNFKIFSPSGSHTTLDFLHQISWHCSDGDPLTGASNARGGMKKWQFFTNISLYLRNDER